MGTFDKLVGAANTIAKPIATMPNSEAEGIKAKKENIDDYTKSVNQEPESLKAAPVTANEDKINSNAKFGDRGNEKRIDTRDMTKPLGSFAKGTTKVPKTQVAVVHKGEAIIPAKENPMNKSMDGVMGLAKDKAPKKEIKEMVHSKTHNGHHIVLHRHHSPSHHPDETHSFADMDSVHSHMEDHAGQPNEGEAAPAGGDQPAPLTASPSPMPQAPPPGA